MTEMENKTIFRRFYEEAWNAGDLTVVDELLATDFVNHEVAETTAPHRELYKRAVVETRTAFPDWTIIIDDLVAEGEKVVARWRSSGTHNGETPGQPPTGARIQIQGITIVRVVEGKIVDFWKQDNSHTVPQQLDAARNHDLW